MLSLVIPVYRSEESIPDLLAAIEELSRRLAGAFEEVFVVDGSQDRSLELLRETLPGGRDVFAVMAADLQESPEPVLSFRNGILSEYL
jgi:glycosyltransferase involved in cell wall biosynthesis